MRVQARRSKRTYRKKDVTKQLRADDSLKPPPPCDCVSEQRPSAGSSSGEPGRLPAALPAFPR